MHPASRRPTWSRTEFLDGFSLHADTSVDAADRPALGRLVRYLLRPLISAERLTARPDGRVEYHFRRSDPSGRTSWVTDGATWCRRLATLIPRAAVTPPGFTAFCPPLTAGVPASSPRRSPHTR